MSAISNLQQALNCAGKCDCCDKLQSQINALKAEIARIPRIDTDAIVEKAKIAIIPLVGGIVVQQTSKFALDVDLKSGLANQAKNLAAEDAKFAADLRNALSDVAYKRELQPIMAEANAARAEAAAKATKADVDGVRGLIGNLKAEITALGESIGSRIAAVERTASKALSVAGDAVSKALEAIGISKGAQTVAGEALAKVFGLASKIAEIFVIIAAIEEIIAQIKTLELLGERIDAVEREIIAVGASVSDVLGRLLGLQNRIAANTASIEDVRGIANNALNIGRSATVLANRAIDIGTQARNEAANALVRAGEAVATTAAILALFRGIKVLKGEPGINGRNGVDGRAGINGRNGIDGLSIPGVNGRNGVDGKNGIDGKNGVTTVVQIPGSPGADGAPGKDGRNGVGSQGRQGKAGTNGTNGIPGIKGKDGKDGVDVNPADIAGLKAFIAGQHASTRANVNATSSGLVAGVQAFFTTQLATMTKLITTIATNTYVEKAMSVLTFAATIHNAFMLSNSLAQTMGTIIDQCVSLVVPKGIDGQPISISNVLGGAVMNIVKNVVGAENYTTITTDLAKANRIYQASVNVFNQVSNATGIITTGLGLIAGNTGKIGNALKVWGVVGEKAYGFMNPQPNLQGKFFNFINTATAEANTIQMMIAIPIGLSAAAVEINSSTKALVKELDQKDPVDKNGNPILDSLGHVVHYKPGETIPDPTATIKAQMQAELDSKNIILATIEDLFDGGD